ncbi:MULTISPECIES: hypothetical protein [Kribbella]|uniref:hypothetical protein n=1 Tax=Kribbella TaxID=182639 RepID=UPI0010520147|nr:MULTISPECIES: hypothetical protein [Kribbella]
MAEEHVGNGVARLRLAGPDRDGGGLPAQRLPHRRGELRHRACGQGHSIVGRAAATDHPQHARPPGLRAVAHHLRPAARRVDVRRRRLHRWPSVHTLDAARLYRLALESAPAGTRLHAVGDEGIEFRRIAEAIGAGLELPVRSVEAEQAAQYVGFLASFVALDNPTSATSTRELLDWQPTHLGLLADLAEGHYFRPTD